MPTHEEIKAAGGNDVGDWGEKKLKGAYAKPLIVGGERVDIDKLPAFGSDEANATAKAPLAPPGTP